MQGGAMLTSAQILQILQEYNLLTDLEPAKKALAPERTFPQVTNDSRQIQPGAVFVAISGAAVDGHKFITQAAKQGAALVISEVPCNDDLPATANNIIVKNSYQTFALLCEAYYSYPTTGMSGFAITGTNGKTTSAMIIRHLLKHSEHSCGMLSTVEYDLGNGLIESADRTTPQAADLFKYFRQMQQNNLTDFVMEISSHALAQHRIGSVKFQAAVFTNLTEDHLDYHHTMSEYFKVKQTLFTHHLHADGIAVINCDDPFGMELAAGKAVRNVLSFGIRHGQWRIVDIENSGDHTAFALTDGHEKHHFVCPLSGLHNIYNIAGAVLALAATGKVSLPESGRILSSQPFSVPGRLEKFSLSNGAKVFVDYAHTDDALKNVLSCLKQLMPQQLICVFGAGGDRDRAKRPLMGKAAAAYADTIYLTSDNPRSEDPEAIIEAIRSGIPDDFAAANLHIIPDRSEAIRQALLNASSNDVILIAGKGHETYQEVAGKKYHFDDREAVRSFIRN